MSLPVLRRASRHGVRAAAVGVTLALVSGGMTSAAPAADSTAAGKTLKKCLAKVRLVQDGDTVTVKLLSSCPGGTKGSTMVVRNAGIQATEVHSSECWSDEAKKNFKRYLPVGKRVRLSSYGATTADRETNRNEVRYLKFMDVKRDGKWFDLQADQLRKGLAMWKPQDVENARDSKYATAQQRGMHDGVGMWGDPSHCGTVQPAAQMQMWINWKTDGPDRAGNANDEFIALRNNGAAPVDLAGWALRDASHLFGSDSSAGAGSDTKTYFVFPNGTRVAAGQTVHVYPGSGNNNVSNLDFYMNKSALPFWRNVHKADAPRTFLGKANAAPGAEAFLVDTERNFRGWAAYPCVVACKAPTVAITDVNPMHTDESLTLKNTGSTPADMTGAVLDYDGLIKKFPTGYTIAAGSTVVVHVAKDGNDDASDLYWPQGSKDHLLRDDGGAIWLRTWNDVTIDFAKWGDGLTGSGEPYDY